MGLASLRLVYGCGELASVGSRGLRERHGTAADHDRPGERFDLVSRGGTRQLTRMEQQERLGELVVAAETLPRLAENGKETETVARQHIEFIEVGDVETVEVGEGPLVGSGLRLLSEDDESGAFTAFCSFPEGWSGDLGAYGRPVEAFVVRGELELDGQRLDADCYAYVPSGSSHGRLAAPEDGQAPGDDRPGEIGRGGCADRGARRGENGVAVAGAGR